MSPEGYDLRRTTGIIGVMPVSRGDDKAIPMPSARSLGYRRRLSSKEAEGLLRGFKPHSMDDKWFFFAEGTTVHMHRSWTGEEIYSFDLKLHGDGSADVTEVHVNDAYPDNDDAQRVLDLLFEKILPQYYGD